MGTIRFLCPDCYNNRYAALRIADYGRTANGQPDIVKAFRCESCLRVHTLSKWQWMREECPDNDWVQDAYSEERWMRVYRNLKKRA